MGPAESSADQKLFLKGRVEHQNSLPPLDPDFEIGSKFRPQEPRYASKWLKIPEWFAGTFEIESSKVEEVYDFATGTKTRVNQPMQSQAVESRGHRWDARNDIWHYYVESGSSTSEQPKTIVHNSVDWYGPLIIDRGKVVMRILATSFIVDRATGTIVDTFRREDLKTYEPQAGGGLRVRWSSKSFDSRGMPRDLQIGSGTHRRVRPFAPVDELGGVDLEKSFSDFLNTTGLSDLIPERERPN